MNCTPDEGLNADSSFYHLKLPPLSRKHFFFIIEIEARMSCLELHCVPVSLRGEILSDFVFPAYMNVMLDFAILHDYEVVSLTI